MPPGIQLTQLDVQGMEAQEVVSQIQAMEAMRHVEEGGGGESEEGENRCWEVPEEMLSDGEPEQRGQQHQGPEAGDTNHPLPHLPPRKLGRQSKSRTTKETIEEKRNGVTETLMRDVGTEWSELDETVKTNIAKAVQDRFKPY